MSLSLWQHTNPSAALLSQLCSLTPKGSLHIQQQGGLPVSGGLSCSLQFSPGVSVHQLEIHGGQGRESDNAEDQIMRIWINGSILYRDNKKLKKSVIRKSACFGKSCKRFWTMGLKHVLKARHMHNCFAEQGLSSLYHNYALSSGMKLSPGAKVSAGVNECGSIGVHVYQLRS